MGIGQCLDAMTSMPGTIAGFALMGLLGGFTHCAAMCGPFVLAQIDGQKAKRDNPDAQSLMSRLSGYALVPYHLGRATTYVMLALLFSTVLNIAFAVMPIRLFIVVPMLLLAAVVFMVAAVPALGTMFPWAVTFHMPVPMKKISQKVTQLMHNPNFSNRYMLGVLLGFMPCGMLLAALMAAAALDTPMKSAFAMIAFTFGTIPSLFVVAAGGHMIRTLYPQTFGRVRQAFLFLSAVWLFVLAGAAVF